MNLDIFKEKKILVIGDVGIDHYIHGTSSRLCPEAPVPVFTPTKQEYRLGLAANVTANIVSLGGQVKLCSLAGADNTSDILNNLLRQHNIEQLTWDLLDRRTTRKIRYYIDKHMLLRVDEEETNSFNPDIMTKFTYAVCKQIKEWADFVVIQDYGKGLITPVLVDAINQCGKPVLVDPSPKQNPMTYYGVTYIKPNKKEYEDQFEKHNYSQHSLMDHLSIKGLIVTEGSNGMTIYEDSNQYHLDAIKKDVIDVCGAGDTVTAALALSLASGMNLVNSTNIANLAAGIVVSKFGTSVVLLEELKEVYDK